MHVKALILICIRTGSSPECECALAQYMSRAGRWVGDLGSSKLQAQHWRMSDTWFMLIRHHAEVVTQHIEIEHEFAMNCAYTGTNPAG